MDILPSLELRLWQMGPWREKAVEELRVVMVMVHGAKTGEGGR
jgi:hypothetical protein